MSDLSAAAPGMVKQAIQVIKVPHPTHATFSVRLQMDQCFTVSCISLQSINTLQKQAEGLCEILKMKPSHTSLEIHREVFGCNNQSDAPLPPVNGASRSRRPIKRAVEEAAATEGYVPRAKTTDYSAEEDELE